MTFFWRIIRHGNVWHKFLGLRLKITSTLKSKNSGLSSKPWVLQKPRTKKSRPSLNLSQTPNSYIFKPSSMKRSRSDFVFFFFCTGSDFESEMIAKIFSHISVRRNRRPCGGGSNGGLNQIGAGDLGRPMMGGCGEDSSTTTSTSSRRPPPIPLAQIVSKR